MPETPPPERRNVEFRSVSIIIPTKDRPDDLEHTIQSVLRQTVLPEEMIIVDQSQDSETHRRTENLFAAHASRSARRIKLRYISDTAIMGAAVARNRAMDIAEGDIWLFLDDDVVLESNFLEELLTAYALYPQGVGISGIVTNYKPPSLVSRLWRVIFVRGPFHDDRQEVYWRADQLRQAAPITVSRLGSGLMSFRAEAIRNLRFDENLHGVSTGEDVDFCMRLIPGTTLMIAPGARLFHARTQTGRPKEHWLAYDALGNCYLHWRHWDQGIKNRLCFYWLNVGYVLLATLVSLRRLSLEPWRALAQGIQRGREQARPN